MYGTLTIGSKWVPISVALRSILGGLSGDPAGQCLRHQKHPRPPIYWVYGRGCFWHAASLKNPHERDHRYRAIVEFYGCYQC